MHENYSSAAFEEKYTYRGHDLGAIWSPRKTVFRLWAPTAQEVYLNLYFSGDPEADDLLIRLPMTADVNGTWVCQRSGDLNGVYYTYLVLVDGAFSEACDPYARTTGVNGQRAMVIDLDSTDPAGWEDDRDPHAALPISDCALYELHVRDFSMDQSSGIRHKGKYLAFTETGTKTKDGSPTGIDHIKALGVTHVHLLPVFDFGFTDEGRRRPQYNWGYDPVNFNVPEGSYSTDPHNGAVRVREFKQMVKALHDNGLSVVMDVVYNHVYKAEEFCVNKIVPGYFSRGDSNGSCCGNDTATERSMVRRYIVDSVNYWADEYHIDGFRFDLMGLMDVQTINKIVTSVHKKHPNVIFYGEGWSMDTQLTKQGYSLAVQGNSAMTPGFSFFSDTIRDLLRGSVFQNTTPGYISGALSDKNNLEESFLGMPQWANEPCQCVNYISCHDNNTLFDRISLAAPEAPVEQRIRMNNLGAAFCILSQGVPFMQAGEELLRTKPGKQGGFDQNSYRSSDKINAIKWDDLGKAEYRETMEYYRGLLAFRKEHSVFRLATRAEVKKRVRRLPVENSRTVSFFLDDEDQEIFAIFNADAQEAQVDLPEGDWDIHISGNKAGTVSLGTVSGSIGVEPISAMVLTRKKPVDVVAALIWEKDKFLICQRPANKARALLWEFVGGKKEPGESLEQALVRECAEELAVNVKVGGQFMQVVHQYPDIFIRLTLFHCTIPVGYPQALEHNDIRWIHPSQVDDFDFCPADTDILKELKRRYEKRKPLS